MTPVSAAQAHEMIHDGRPLAILDVREAGQFGEGHALFAVPLPYSQLEIRIGQLVPRLSERVLLIDQGDRVAERAAARLDALGYSHLHVLTGGMQAWTEKGYGTYKGVNVPSKIMGELAETLWHPRMLTPDQLAAWRAAGQPHRLFDGRPAEEFARMRIPGAECLPNGELAHRAGTLDGADPVVITCAGRTRGIVGAIGLDLVGYPGPVFALENGTQGWALSGGALDRDSVATRFPHQNEPSQAASREAAERLSSRFDLRKIDGAGADAMLRDETRTMYLLDVRTADEISLSPVDGAVHAPCGQLVQATDQWIGVRHAAVILCCDTGLRSALSAFWLSQLGYDCHVLPLDEGRKLTVLPCPAIRLPRIATIEAGSALAAMHEGAALIDLRGSMAYRSEHVAGASWGIRPRLRHFAAQSRPRREILLVSDKAEEASLAAADLLDGGARTIRLIEGGLDALRRAGAAIEATPALPPDADCIDYLFFVHDRHNGNMDAARRYLSWETGLIDQLSPEERAEFLMIRP